MESHTKNTANTKIYPASGPSWGGKTPTAASILLLVYSHLICGGYKCSLSCEERAMEMISREPAERTGGFGEGLRDGVAREEHCKHKDLPCFGALVRDKTPTAASILLWSIHISYAVGTNAP